MYFVCPSPFLMVCMLNPYVWFNIRSYIITILLTLMLCALIANLLTMMQIFIHMMIFFDECYARLIAMIKTLNEPHMHFISGMKECDLITIWH